MKDERLYLLDILERVEHIETYTQSGETSFLANLLTQKAIQRHYPMAVHFLKTLKVNIAMTAIGKPTQLTLINMIG